jgi:ABC-type sugar transport system, permease component
VATQPDVITSHDEAQPPRPAAQAAKRKAGLIRTLPRALVLLIATIVMLFPLYVVIVNSFKANSQIISDPLGLPIHHFSFRYVKAVFTSGDFNVTSAYVTTISLVIVVNILSIACTAPASYVIARSRSRWRSVLLIYFLLGTFVPTTALIIPVVYVLRYLGLIGTFPGLVALQTCLTLPLSVFLFTGFIATIPREIDEAASIDGAGQIRTFWMLIFPLMRPAVATVVILNSLGVWNDFVNPQTILGPASGHYTITTGLYAAIGRYFTDYTVVFPDLLLIVGPVLIFFLALQRFIIGGLVSGATKG